MQYYLAAIALVADLVTIAVGLLVLADMLV